MSPMCIGLCSMPTTCSDGGQELGCWGRHQGSQLGPLAFVLGNWVHAQCQARWRTQRGLICAQMPNEKNRSCSGDVKDAGSLSYLHLISIAQAGLCPFWCSYWTRTVNCVREKVCLGSPRPRFQCPKICRPASLAGSVVA